MLFEKELITFLLGAAPISEVRGAIPVAMGAFHFSATKAYLLAVGGNLLPVLPFLYFLDKLSALLMSKLYIVNRFLTWLFERTRRQHADHFHYWKWGPLALLLFVAIPLPLTGAWSGVVAAYVFGIPFWRSALMISLGVLLAGVIVLLLTSLGIFTFNSFAQ
ncbi:MAG: small multi-drug export protein [Parcubacteria group bacterium]|nr:small multi-drug export protein [Parcubacteria group bacterium]